MASPFSIFRKHQRILMVVLVIMAMFAFTLSDLFSSGSSNLPLLCLMLGAGLLAAVGWSRNQVLPYTAVGAVAGLVIGFVGPMFAGSDAVVSTSAGEFNQQQLMEMQSRRAAANQFVQAYWYAAERKASKKKWDEDEQNEGKTEQEFDNQFNPTPLPPRFRFGFGGRFERDVILGFLLRKEAATLGIRVTDDAVNAMLQEMTKQAGAGLNGAELKEARSRVQYMGGRISETELFEILREELVAKLAVSILLPGIPPTPDRYWDMYQRFQVEQEVEAVRLPVESFAALEADPTDAEQETFFEEWKSRFPNQENGGDPGFMQPTKLQIAYLEVDFLAAEKLVDEITEEQIAQYYEDNKDARFKNFVPDEDTGSAPSPPELPNPNSNNNPPGEAANEQEPAKEDPAKEDPAKEDPAKEDPAKEDPAKEDPAKEDPAKEDPAKEDPAKEDPAKEDGDSCSQPPAASEPNATPDSSPSPKPAETGESTETENPKDDDPGSADGADDTKDTTSDSPESSEDTESSSEDAPLLYQPLEAVRDTIRDELLQAATSEFVNSRTFASQQKMRTLAESYFTVNPEDGTREKSAEQIASELKAYAEAEPAISYIETPALSFRDLSEDEDYKDIGSATDPNVGGLDTDTLAQSLFSSEPREFTLQVAETDPGNQLVYWVTRIVPAHVPESIAEVKSEVIDAWKQDRAREKAKARAEQIQKQIQAQLESGKSFEDALADQKLTTGDDAETLSDLYVYTQPFSWLQQSSAPGMSFNRPVQLSTIVGINGADNEFMRYIFRDLAEGDVGIRASFDRSEYYVMLIRNRKVVLVQLNPVTQQTQQKREPLDDASLIKLQERFLRDLATVSSPFFQFTSPLPQLMQADQQQISMDWSQRLVEKYNVNWAPGIFDSP